MPQEFKATPFGTYLRRWFKAAAAPAYDLLGVAGVVVGAVLWAWHRFWSENFRWAAGRAGLSPEAAVSDLVWGIPLTLGFAVLAYRLVRAPYEMHVEAERRVWVADTAQPQHRMTAEDQVVYAILTRVSTFLVEAEDLERRVITERGSEVVAEEALQWYSTVADYLARDVGPDYAARFKAAVGSGIQINYPSSGKPPAVLARVRGRKAFLEQALREIRASAP
ncbi:MAG TPA: hypothetical protein VM846_20190 [Vicinamibacterales bacterium]|jgi:hypothetical protein|nr:hypothetical protein [Vicinamibacterales bacterium]